ncbi:ABCAC protein, partial [Drymodes brunneopygia]|nr:ABCAC protein [Drymodes brunneopygia]
AVDNLSLNFYEGNITSLLGHNGAGKTTTISILTGLFPTSSGTIFVYGKDIRTDQEVIRKNMGVCMQHNVLFNYLTTKEHLLLYGYIKVPHCSKHELYQEVMRTLKETGLYSHRHKLAGTLSGGMKRKLSIAIALLGGSRVVILDEPTTGVDPCSRRSIWEIISKNKKGRTIILSTHHLDEAEVLSDRIAFLEHGGLKCCGSPFYLKETFGDGYHLTLTKKKNMIEECDTTAVTSLIQSYLPEAYLKEDIGGELVYVLP